MISSTGLVFGISKGLISGSHHYASYLALELFEAAIVTGTYTTAFIFSMYERSFTNFLHFNIANNNRGAIEQFAINRWVHYRYSVVIKCTINSKQRLFLFYFMYYANELTSPQQHQKSSQYVAVLQTIDLKSRVPMIAMPLASNRFLAMDLFP